MNQPDLSIVLPAYCEERRIGKTLDELAEFLKSDTFFKHKIVEVIVVAADAPDRTHEIIKDKQDLFMRFVFLKPGPRVGKGRDVQYGMMQATGKYIIFMDADLATPLQHVGRFYKLCEQGSDVVIAERKHIIRHPNAFRRITSSIGTKLFVITTGLQINDTQCGFKMFNQRANQICFTKLTILGWWFDLDVLAVAKANSLLIKAITIDDWQAMPNSTYTESGLNIAISYLFDLLKLKRKLNAINASRQN